MQNNGGFFQKLWSSKSVSRQQPTVSSNNSPSFNASNFGSSLGASISNTGSPSSFYAGRVRYGGAMSASRNNLSSPYVVPSITKAKRRSKSIDESQSSKSLNKKVSGTLSSTARRIFQALERMSTPLRDMKRIPPPSTKIFGKPQRKRSIGATLLESSKRSCPPSRGITISSRVNQSSTPNIPLDNSLSTQSILKNISADSQTSSSPVVYKGKPAIMASLSSSAGMKLKKSTGIERAGGKMRVPRKTAAHYSNVMDNEEPEIQEMPDLNSIPISVSSLPKFDFGGPGSTSTPALPKSNTSKASNFATKSIVFSEPVYTFSPPIAAPSPRKHMLFDGKVSEKFQFSSPVSTKQKTSRIVNMQSNPEFAQKDLTQLQSNKLSQPKSTPVLKIHGSVMDVLGSKLKSFEDSVKQKNPTGDSAKVPKPSLGEIFKMSNDSWECGVCMVKNSKEMTKCVACQSIKPGEEDLPVNNNSNMWICDVCLIKNKNTRDQCEACESPRHGNARPKSQLVVGNDLSKWECEVCMVRNDKDRKSCEACQAPKPGKKSQTPKSVNNNLPKNSPTKVFSGNVGSFFTPSTSHGFSFGAVTKEKPVVETKVIAKWDCEVCLVQNDQNRTSCEACEAVKPDQKQNANEAEHKSSSTFKFGIGKESSSSKWDCQVCLVPNDAERTRCIACESPKPGLENTEANKPQKNSSFKFGSTSSTVFQFGNPSKTADMSTAKITSLKPSSNAPTSATDSIQPGFKFGAPSSSSNDKVVSSTSVAPISVSQKSNSSLNFGTKSTSRIETSVTNETPNPTFSFGEKLQAGHDPAVAKPNLMDSSIKSGAKNAGFSFGAKSHSDGGSVLEKLHSTSSSENKTLKTSYTFGAASPDIQFKATQTQPSLGISSLTGSSAQSEPSKLPFSFGAKPTCAPSNQQTVGAPSFTFGTSGTSQSGSALSIAAPLFASGFSSQIDKNISSSTVKQSTDSGSAIKNMLTSKQPSLFGSANARDSEPTDAAKPPSLVQKTSSNLSAATSEKPASGFQFQAAQNQKPRQGFTFGSKLPTSGFSQDPPSFGSGLTTIASNQGFSKPAEQKLTPFNTSGQQKVGEKSAPSSFSGFGTKQGDKSSFGQDGSSLPKPSFGFGNPASNASSQIGNTSVFGSNAGTTQTSGFAFGSGNNGNLPQAQNPPAFGSSQTAAKSSFAFGSSEPPKPSGTFQFGSSQNSQPAPSAPGGFSFGNAQSQSNNPAPSTGFNFNTAAQNTTNPMFPSMPSTGFQFGAGQNHQQLQSKPDSTSGFAFGTSSGQPPAFGQNMPTANSSGSLFSIGQGSTQGRSSTPVRQMKQARRRLRPNIKN